MQIAQAAFALFHVWFDHIALAALFAVAGAAFFQLGLDEFRAGAVEKIVPQGFFQFIGQRGITRQIAFFQQGGADGKILGSQTDAILDGAAGVANLQAQIPQDIQHGFDHAFGPCGHFVGGQKQQVDVGMRGHFSAARSAHSQYAQAFGISGVGYFMQTAGGDLKGGFDQTIGQIGIGTGGAMGSEGGGPKGGLDCCIAALAGL